MANKAVPHIIFNFLLFTLHIQYGIAGVAL